MSVRRVRGREDLSKKAKTKVYNAAISACKNYMEAKNPSSTSGKERLAMVGDILSQLRAEKNRIMNERAI